MAVLNPLLLSVWIPLSLQLWLNASHLSPKEKVKELWAPFDEAIFPLKRPCFSWWWTIVSFLLSWSALMCLRSHAESFRSHFREFIFLVCLRSGSGCLCIRRVLPYSNDRTLAQRRWRDLTPVLQYNRTVIFKVSCSCHYILLLPQQSDLSDLSITLNLDEVEGWYGHFSMLLDRTLWYFSG